MEFRAAKSDASFAVTFTEYLESLAKRPATLQRPERRERRACVRCDGEVFFLYTDRDPVCAGCGAILHLGHSPRSS